MNSEMYIKSLIVASLVVLSGIVNAQFGEKKIEFSFFDEPIDVVIVARNKSLVEDCIKSIKEYGQSIRDIYVVSPKKITDKAIWISEDHFPFTPLDIARHIFKNEERAQSYIDRGRRRIGWYLQQLLKLYAPIVIDNISSNVLILDSDVIFLSPVQFMNEKNEPLFCTSGQNHKPYFRHGARLLPGFNRCMEVSGICHHMLFQKNVIEHLFSQIESAHHMPSWQAICECIELYSDESLPSTGCSEYEIYFNFFFASSEQGHIRRLRWRNVSKDFPVWNQGVNYQELYKYKAENYVFISRH